MTHLSPRSIRFPDARAALADPNGLLAVGGDLSPERLLAAYRSGIFPWYDDDDGPILWWSPDPRAALEPTRLRITRSLAKRLRQAPFRVTFDEAFTAVLEGCAAPRIDRTGRESGTWITHNMRVAYASLHALGYAHSIECWSGETLVGGLYGVSLGRVFFGESMFSRESDASKIALVHLARQLAAWGFTLIDCQVMNPHLEGLGAENVPRHIFLDLLSHNLVEPTRRGRWMLEATPG